MDSYWESFFSYQTVPTDHPFLPNTQSDVFIMGQKYKYHNDNDAIQQRLYSLYWMTYRKCFSPIGSPSGPTTDAGWGCMHRCSQMMLAEAITRTKFGVDWHWKPGCSDDDYFKLCALFQDCTNALYSIHNITQTGVSVGKDIRSWFGPNTAVQVIKKLTAYDQWIDWAVHITIEDGVIVDEIKSLCRRKRHCVRSQLEMSGANEINTTERQGTVDEDRQNTCATSELEQPRVKLGEFEQLSSSPVRATVIVDPTKSKAGDYDRSTFTHSVASFDGNAEIIAPVPVMQDLEEDFLEVVIPSRFEQPAFPDERADQEDHVEQPEICQLNPNDKRVKTDSWRPLLLFIPLRLGLQTANPCYFEAVKGSLRIAQSVGILGGRPGHAFWIVGVVGDKDVLCLDPHEIQFASDDGIPTPADDASHHCGKPSLIPLTKLDPSLVLGFVCPTENDFDLLCDALSQHLLSPEASCGRPLFELHQRRPYNLPPVPTVVTESATQVPGEQCQPAALVSGLSIVSTPEGSSGESSEVDVSGFTIETESTASQQLVSSLRLAGSHLTSGLRMLAPNADTLKSIYRRVVPDPTDASNGTQLPSPPVSSDHLSC